MRRRRRFRGSAGVTTRRYFKPHLVYGAASLSGSFCTNGTTRTVAGVRGLGGETERGNFAPCKGRVWLKARRGFTMPSSFCGLDTITPLVALEIAQMRSDGVTEQAIAGPGQFAFNVSGQGAADVPNFVGPRFARMRALGGPHRREGLSPGFAGAAGAQDRLSLTITPASSPRPPRSPMYWPNSRQERLTKPSLEEAPGDEDIHFHDLCHIHATYSLVNWMHLKLAQEHLDCSTIGITLDLNSHAMPGMQSDATAKVDAAIWAAQEKGVEAIG